MQKGQSRTRLARELIDLPHTLATACTLAKDDKDVGEDQKWGYRGYPFRRSARVVIVSVVSRRIKCHGTGGAVNLAVYRTRS